MPEKKVTLWLARDDCGDLFFYNDEPEISTDIPCVECGKDRPEWRSDGDYVEACDDLQGQLEQLLGKLPVAKRAVQLDIVITPYKSK